MHNCNMGTGGNRFPFVVKPSEGVLCHADDGSRPVEVIIEVSAQARLVGSTEVYKPVHYDDLGRTRYFVEER